MVKWFILAGAFKGVTTQPRWFVHSMYDGSAEAIETFDAMKVPACYDDLALLMWSFTGGLQPIAAKSMRCEPAEAMCQLRDDLDESPELMAVIRSIPRVEWVKPAALPVSPPRESWRERSV